MEQCDKTCMNCKHQYEEYDENPCLCCKPLELQNWEERE
jgi:hypothetical protein